MGKEARKRVGLFRPPRVRDRECGHRHAAVTLDLDGARRIEPGTTIQRGTGVGFNDQSLHPFGTWVASIVPVRGAFTCGLGIGEVARLPEVEPRVARDCGEGQVKGHVPGLRRLPVVVCIRKL